MDSDYLMGLGVLALPILCLNPLRFGVWILTKWKEVLMMRVLEGSQSPSIRGMDSDGDAEEPEEEPEDVSIPFDSGYGF